MKQSETIPEQQSEAEIARRRDEALRRALTTLPQPRKVKDSKKDGDQ